MKKNKNVAIKIVRRLLAGPKNLFYYEINKPLKPKWLWFEVTDKCNSRCTNCHIWQKKPTANIITASEIEKALSDPLFSDLECIINSGGEVTMREDIEEIILIEHKLFPGASFDFSTNGLAPDRALKIIKSVLEKGVRLNVGVSLDAIGEKHDEIRGVKGNFQSADYLLRQLVILKKHFQNLSVIIGETLSPLTLPYVDSLKRYAEKLGVELSSQWFNQSSFYDNFQNRITDEQKAGDDEEMRKAVLSLPDTIHKEMWLNWLKNKPIKFKCFALNTFCVLRCDGSIAPCLSYWDDVIGNVKEESPSEIWKSEKAQIVRGKVKKCQGCLNSWGVWWSVGSSVYPRLIYYIRNPKIFVRDIISKF